MVEYYDKIIQDGDEVPNTNLIYNNDDAYEYYKDYRVMSITRTAKKHNFDKGDMYYYMVAFRSNGKLYGKRGVKIDDADRANSQDSKE